MNQINKITRKRKYIMDRRKDTLMITSSALYIIPAAIYYKIGDMIGAILFTLVAFTSVMADGIYFGVRFYRLLDRFLAPLCYIYACVNIFIHAYKYCKQYLLCIIIIMIIPLLFYYKSKQIQLKNPYTYNHRYWHICWHIACVTALSLILIYFYL